MPTSSRLAIVTPSLASTPVDIPADMLAIVTALEARGAGYSQGTFAARPAAGKTGWFYWDTTNAVLWYDNGSIWIGPIGTPAAGSITQAMLAAGAAAGQSYGTAFPTSSLYNGYRFTLFMVGAGTGTFVSPTVGGDYIYRADLDATRPWFAVAATKLSCSVAGPVSTASTSNVAVGAAITVPRTGYYDASLQFYSDNGAMEASLYNGSSGQIVHLIESSSTGTTQIDNASRETRILCTATESVNAQFRSTDGASRSIQKITVTLTPVNLI